MRCLASPLWLLLLMPRFAGAAPKPCAAAPLEYLGPPDAPGAAVRIQALGTTVEIAGSRRSARVVARWRLTGPPGEQALRVRSSLFQVEFEALAGPGAAARPLPAQMSDGDPPPQLDLRTDEGERCRLGADPPHPPRYVHQVVVPVPPSGQLELRTAAVLSSGFDRNRRERRFVERAHYLHRRPDFFVYEFAVRGPPPPVTLAAPPQSETSAGYRGGVLRFTATRRRVFPLGATLGAGLSVGTQADEPERVVRAHLRGSLDLLLPYGDALSLQADGGTQFVGRTQVGLGLVYQLYTGNIPFLPLGGHLDLGAAADLWPERRFGIRVGLGLHIVHIGLLPTVDLFPQKVPPPPGEGGGERFAMRYRFSLLLAVGL